MLATGLQVRAKGMGVNGKEERHTDIKQMRMRVESLN